jgi:N-acyl homoserine lactone hydrolase
LVRLPHSGAILLAIDAVMMQHTFTPDRKAWPHDDNEEQLRASTVRLLELVERENIQLVVFWPRRRPMENGEKIRGLLRAM